jgi:hypothetical protein
MVFAACFLLAVCPAYLQYNDVTEIDFLSPHPSFENPDQENLLTDEQSRTKIAALNFSPEISLFAILPSEPIPIASFQIISLELPATILRC